MSEPCYHCGLPIPEEIDLEVKINGEPRHLCCYGCQAVAESIVLNGLEDYYRTRDAMPESPREAVPAVLAQLPLFDHADFQKSFVKTLGETEKEASLLLEGITCSACIWLNEQHLSRLKGVIAVDINYATRRARVRWDDARIQLSEILGAIAAIGYRAYPYDAAKNEEIAQKERREALWRVWVAGFGMMQVMMYAFPVYIANGDMTADIESLMRWASLLLTLPVVFYSSAPFFKNSWRDIKLRRVGMDVPVALGVGASFLASCWATFNQTGEVYFDSVSMFVFFLLGGRYLEMTARQKAVSVTEALAKLLPAFAQKVPKFPVDRNTEQCLVADLSLGDVVLVRAGDAVPADGVVLEGVSACNESMLTGESRPVSKKAGDVMTGGALNIESPVYMRVDQIGEETRLSAIVRLMERAALEKPGIVVTADRVASYFVFALLLVAIFTAVGWYYVDPAKALWITVSVLVVTCPCSLSLATPIALTVAAGAFAKGGMLVTRGHAIETLAAATHFVFDKTGTLTTGKMRLLDKVALGSEDADACWAIAALVEQASEHPLAFALKEGAPSLLAEVTEVLSVAGQGIEAKVSGEKYRVGRLSFVKSGMAADLPDPTLPWEKCTDSIVYLAGTGGFLAAFRVGDEVRPEAASLVASLLESGKTPVMLTGDAFAVAQPLAEAIGITQVVAEVPPQGKYDFVKSLQAQGAVVAMVGDGVNDAPVMAQAQVSVAMGGGAQLARTQADFLLLSENLQHLNEGVSRSVLSLKIIRQNLWWSVIYNLVALPLAIAGWVSPWLAGIGMSASSLLVVLNSLRIQKKEG